MDAVSGSLVLEAAGVSLALLVVGGVEVGMLAATVGRVGNSVTAGGDDPGTFLGVGLVYTEQSQYSAKTGYRVTYLRGRVLCCH